MGLTKRAMEREYVLLDDLEGIDLECMNADCSGNGGSPMYLVIDGLGRKYLVCSGCVDADSRLCAHCGHNVADGNEVPNKDWHPVPTCTACEERFYH